MSFGFETLKRARISKGKYINLVKILFRVSEIQILENCCYSRIFEFSNSFISVMSRGISEIEDIILHESFNSAELLFYSEAKLCGLTSKKYKSKT